MGFYLVVLLLLLISGYHRLRVLAIAGWGLARGGARLALSVEVAVLEGFLLLLGHEGEIGGAGLTLVLGLEPVLLVASGLLVASLFLVPLPPLLLLHGGYLVEVHLD
jgi:hypothetical protein